LAAGSGRRLETTDRLRSHEPMHEKGPPVWGPFF